MANGSCVKRLQKELRNIQRDPIPYCVVAPAPKNILEWHYVLLPPTGCVYEGGEYHGRIVFPPTYPFKPPAIFMDTPSGRFTPGKSICLSMSEYHPEQWNPLWSISSIVSGLLSFMLEKTPTTGTINTNETTKRKFAQSSSSFNELDPMYRVLFYKNDAIHKARVEREATKIIEQLQEEENGILQEQASSSRVTMLIGTAIGAFLICLFSVIIQVWLSQQNDK